MEYVTRYPKTVSFGDGGDNKIHVDKKTGVRITFNRERKCRKNEKNSI